MKNTQVKTWDAEKPEEALKVVVIDFDQHNSRSWLIRHMVWAMNTGKSVFMTATTDEVNYAPEEGEKPVKEKRRPSRRTRCFTRVPGVREP